MRADAMDALVQVREGAPLASALAGKKRFPGIAGDVRAPGRADRPAAADAASAPRTSSAPKCSAARMQMATILEPLLIVAMGGVVMLIVLAVLLPIIQLNSFVK